MSNHATQFLQLKLLQNISSLVIVNCGGIAAYLMNSESRNSMIPDGVINLLDNNSV